jgi:hypothetical protein
VWLKLSYQDFFNSQEKKSRWGEVVREKNKGRKKKKGHQGHTETISTYPVSLERSQWNNSTTHWKNIKGDRN